MSYQRIEDCSVTFLVHKKFQGATQRRKKMVSKHMLILNVLILLCFPCRNTSAATATEMVVFWPEKCPEITNQFANTCKRYLPSSSIPFSENDSFKVFPPFYQKNKEVFPIYNWTDVQNMLSFELYAADGFMTEDPLLDPFNVNYSFAEHVTRRERGRRRNSTRFFVDFSFSGFAAPVFYIAQDYAPEPSVHQKFSGSSGDLGSDFSSSLLDNSSIVVYVVLLGTSILGLIVLAIWFYQAQMRKKKTKRRETFFKLNGHLLLKKQIAHAVHIKIFAMEEMERATDKFNGSRIIGRGGSSIVYKGMLPDGTVVAIKKAINFDETRIDEFIDEIVILSRINHKNMVELLGCCLETQVPLLVYDFVPNGTLSQHLHDVTSASFLSWEHRLKIAVEVAEALAYMHSFPNRPIIHRDIKSTNILLDGNFHAKVSDFGVSRLLPSAETHVTTLVRGSLGYLDPEYYQSGQLTEKSDVYSFGVVLAELMTSEKAIFTARTEEVEGLANHFVKSMKGNHLMQILDPRLVDERNVDEFHMVAMIAERCLGLTGKDRPNMKVVAAELLHLMSKEKIPRKQRGFKKIRVFQNVASRLIIRPRPT
ncbi:wall-associated receptor kinase-like 1 [Macadamia integrifolia]|uniref:wall-associated receptor kinase-like 1 n=1 Tax=Macadamia integrifolia TaxID=60698 RepID=UPI001C4F97AA|nr:wall-associated receptor kinase-like 1 [Macadamia integrifolia]